MRHGHPMLLKGLAIAAALLSAALLSPAVQAEEQNTACTPVDAKTALDRWSNPHPDAADMILELGGAAMASGMRFVFTPAVLSGSSFFGDENSVFEAGARDARVFEGNRKVRVASPVFDSNKRPVLLAGKYEVSLAQYVWVRGKGDLKAGLASLPLPPELAAYASGKGACPGILTAAAVEALARPVHDLTAEDYRTFINEANLACFAHEACAARLAGLSKNPDIPASLRLPAPHEWEFLARGGARAARVDGFRLPGADADLVVPDGLSLADIAHFDQHGPDAGPLPIGAKASYAGLFDLYGNVRELVSGPFLAEGGSGAVGGVTARGGSFSSYRENLRASAVVELSTYRAGADGGPVPAPLPDTGLRLMLGLPIAGVTARLGSDELERIFSAAYSDIGTGKDRAGNSFVDAKAMREPKSEAEAFEDELGSDDPVDMFRFALGSFADLRLEMTNSAPLRLIVYDDLRQPLFDKVVTAGSYDVPGLLPGRYYAEMRLSAGLGAADVSYGVKFRAVAAPDTGLDGASIERQAFDKRDVVRLDGPWSAAFEGYVGPEDIFDTYAVILDGTIDSLDFKLAQTSGAVRINVLDSRGKPLASRGLGDEESGYPVPVAAGSKVFVQVEAGENVATRYQLSVVGAQLQSPQLKLGALGEGETATTAELSGYLHEGAKTLYYRVNIAGRKKLRAELAGLDRDIDMVVLDPQGNALASDHRRSGTDPEVFEQDVPGGLYVVALNRKSGPGTMAPFDLSVQQDVAAELAAADLGQLREKAQTAAVGVTPVRLPGSIQYFLIEPPAELTRLRVTMDAKARFSLVIEDEKGTVVTETKGSANFNAGPSSGRHYVRLAFDGELPREGTLQVEKLGSVSGRSTGTKPSDTVEAWSYGRDGNSCFAFTHAVDMAPANGWLNEMPFFYVAVDFAGPSSAYLGAATEDQLDSSKPTSTRFGDSKGKWQEGKFIWHEGRLKLVYYDKRQKSYFLNNDAIRRMQRSRWLEIKGKTANGRDAKLVYDLRGAEAALTAIVKLCKLRKSPFR